MVHSCICTPCLVGIAVVTKLLKFEIVHIIIIIKQQLFIYPMPSVVETVIINVCYCHYVFNDHINVVVLQLVCS